MSGQPGGELILYQRGDAPAIDVRLDGDTVWLSQQQLADLFQTSRTNVVEHIANIYVEGELSQTATCREFRQVRTEGSRQVARTLPFYNLDLIISLGYRVRSSIATQFRIWATERLKEYLVKGFTMDDARLRNLGGGSYWKELIERIRDIRSSEKVKELKNKAKDEELTPKEKRALTAEEREYKSKRKLIQEKLIKFATRIPAFMYLTDFRENTLQDVITKLEPDLFQTVTGLTVQDFHLLVRLRVFNTEQMNQAVFAFRRYEDASLRYTGIESHEGLTHYGLYSTVVAVEEKLLFSNEGLKRL